MRIFDTSYVIDLSNSDEGAINTAKVIAREGSVAALSVVSVHEYLVGVYLRYFGKNEILATKLQSAERDLSPFMILPLTREIAAESSRILVSLMKKGQIIGINDLYIASTAFLNKASVVTRNMSHFKRIEGLSVEKY